MITNYKPKYSYYYLIGIIVIVIIIALCMIEISNTEVKVGLYYCDDKCYISTDMSMEEYRKIKSNDLLIIDNEEYQTNMISSKKVDEFIPFMNVIYEIPPQDYFNYQQIEYKRVIKNNKLMTIIFNAMKGGDETR